MRTLEIVKSIILIVFTLSVVNCSLKFPTQKGYAQLMESWVGSPEANLLNSPVWGIPDSSYVSGGTAYLKYISERTHTTPGRAPKLTTTRRCFCDI